MPTTTVFLCGGLQQEDSQEVQKKSVEGHVQNRPRLHLLEKARMRNK